MVFCGRVMTVVTQKSCPFSEWFFIRVVSHEGGLMRVVSHRGSISPVVPLYGNPIFLFQHLYSSQDPGVAFVVVLLFSKPAICVECSVFFCA